MHPVIQQTLESIEHRNPGEPIFYQATREVLETLTPVIEEHPEIGEQNILTRLCEPERQLAFRVVWEDDQGQVQVNRGYRVAFSSVLGPYKGGLRFHPSVNNAIVKFLGFEQTFKNSLTGLQLGSGKGGADFNPRGRSEREIMRFCQSFMTMLYKFIGSHTDVPAGDMGVSQREIGYLFGQYKRLTGQYELGVITGKDARWGGSLARTEATGFGCAYFARELLNHKGDALEGKTCIVSGSGNVALYTIRKLQQLGAHVIACSDSEGTVYDEKGIDFDLLRVIKEVERRRVSEYAEHRDSAVFRKGESVWSIPCDCAFPCATQNEILEKDATELVENGCLLICEAANMPCTPEAIDVFRNANVLFGPAKAVNAGGVAVSALEMQQNAGLEKWTFDQVDSQLQVIMHSIHENCRHYAEKYASPDNYIAGANIGGFLRVAHGMLSQGYV